MTEKKKNQTEEQNIDRSGLIGCLIFLIVVIGGCGWCIITVSEVSEDVKKENRQRMRERELFQESLEGWRLASKASKPNEALMLHLRFKDEAESEYWKNIEFRKSTNYAIRLLFIANFEEGLEFCNQGRQKFFACENRKRN